MNGENSQEFYDELIDHFMLNLNLKSNTQKILLKYLLKILNCKTMWDVEKQFEQLLQNQQFKDSNLKSSEQIYKYVIKFLTGGDVKQIERFISQSYYQFNVQYLSDLYLEEDKKFNQPSESEKIYKDFVLANLAKIKKAKG